MDDLDKVLYAALSKEKIEKEISKLKKKQENVEDDFEKLYLELQIKELNSYLQKDIRKI